MEELKYGIQSRLPGVAYADAKARIVAALAEEGFGIITEIDVKATMKKKLDIDFRAYSILGACNPKLAHQALESEIAIGLLLPCNVAVWEDAGGSVIAYLRPDAMVEMTNNQALAPVATEASLRLARALAKASLAPVKGESHATA